MRRVPPIHGVRQKSVHGSPKPRTPVERVCAKCGASFIELAPGRTGLMGVWGGRRGWTWWCSVGCSEADG